MFQLNKMNSSVYINKKEILTKMKYTNKSKSIEKKLLMLCFYFYLIFAFSQDYHLKFGVKAGWNYSNVNAIDDKGEPSGYLSNGGELYGGIVFRKTNFRKSLYTVRIYCIIYRRHHFYRTSCLIQI
ncbi:hypothetical protein [Chryseobacterium carnipullorum]|uniref:hypothetical protein n=1 Tax=Chryseobacterium carnipullorum TaxID=1124835 RepID=UPI000FE19A21|nr:hypothetical protein [Chryseobacterium carnipullorum]